MVRIGGKRGLGRGEGGGTQEASSRAELNTLKKARASGPKFTGVRNGQAEAKRIHPCQHRLHRQYMQQKLNE